MKKWLYNKNADATIFHGEEAINKALESGWVDTPAKLQEQDAMEAVVVETKTRSRKNNKG
jgi:hypothetical protein